MSKAFCKIIYVRSFFTNKETCVKSEEPDDNVNDFMKGFGHYFDFDGQTWIRIFVSRWTKDLLLSK